MPQEPTLPCVAIELAGPSRQKPWRWIIGHETAVDLAAKTPPTEAQRLQASRHFAIEAACLAQQTRCHSVLVLDMAGITPITDFYIIATGTSARQMRSVCDEIDELALKSGFKSFRRSGYEGETWIAVDYVDVVLHIFNQDARHYYDLENLWGDAKHIDWQNGQSKA